MLSYICIVKIAWQEKKQKINIIIKDLLFIDNSHIFKFLIKTINIAYFLTKHKQTN